MRMNKYLSFAIVAMTWLLGSSSALAQHEHDYVNGICTYDECVAPDKFEKPTVAADGFYELRNAGNVEYLSWEVSQGKIDSDARLMNDIDFEGKENLHSPIGPDNGKKYNATFDGQGFRIKNMIINRPNSERQGFFGALRGNPNSRGEGSVIKNLIIDKSCSIIGGKRTGGICGSGQNNALDIYIINCVNEANVTSNTNNVAGILGGSDSTHPKWHIINCVNTGTITSSVDGHEAAGITSWCGDNASTEVRNCINIGEIVGMDGNGRSIFRHSGSLTAKNNFDLSPTEGSSQINDLSFDPEDITSGRLCYIINGDQSEIKFWQTLGTDEYPTPIQGSSLQVFASGHKFCDGTEDDGVTYNNIGDETIQDDHEFYEGEFFCNVCGKIDPNFCEQIEGVYQLNTVRDLEWFGYFVNEGNTTVNARLNSDLDLTGSEFNGIGTRDMGYKGTFDGGYHTISNMDMSGRLMDDWVGFFNFLNGGATIKNLRADATCIINANSNAGLIGGSTSSGDIHLTNLGFEGDVTVNNAGAGGIIGCNTGSSAKVYMENCYATGYITGNGIAENGALSAWLGSNGAVVTNCWSSATVYPYQSEDKYLFRHDNATVTNCYATAGSQGKIIEWEEMETGSLCYKLNGDQSSYAWFQTLGEDEFPTFLPSHKIVYPATELECDGSFNAEEMTFSNDEGSVSQKPHTYKDGFCSFCNHQDPEYPFLDVFANADHDIKTGYTTVNSGDGSGLAINNSVAEHWNMKFFKTTQPITGLQQGVYKLRVQGLQRVCQWDNDGEEYGEGQLSEEFKPMYHSSQYFAEVGGHKIANLFKDIAEDAQEERVNETENDTNEGLWIPNSLAACKKYFAKGLYWNAPLYFYVENENDTINVGVENCMYKYGNWTVWDTWRVEYVGNDSESYNLIRKQQAETYNMELTEMEAQTSLITDYVNASDAIESAATLQEILDAANILSTNPLLIRESVIAYQNYDAAIKTVMAEREANTSLNGAVTELLDAYLNDYDEPSEELPNGTYGYIMEEKPLDKAALEAEIAFIQALYKEAVRTSIDEGADLTELIVNPAFDQDSNFAGWTETHTQLSDAGSNFSSNSGYTEIYPVAGTWNTSFDVHQDLEEGLPNGIYEIEAPAFFRPGGNGQGDLDGMDYVTASLYINDYYTPIMNIYTGQVLYEDAINGVNCRYDATGDPDAPHNGQDTGAQDFDTGIGYVPEQRQAVSFAFGGGRYINKVYGIVTDGKVRLGIRNTGKPYYNSEMTMWGKFKLTYMGKSEEAMESMVENFQSHLESLTYAQELSQILYSKSHTEKIDNLLRQAKGASEEAKMEILSQINAEFNATLTTSVDIYTKLATLADWCIVKGDEYAESDPDLQDAFYAISDEIMGHTYEGDLTDEEALEFYESIQDREEIGGGIYVQGDLLDENGEKLDYSNPTKTYRMTKNADGKYVARIKVQDRSNQPNANGRAGVYFTRLESTIKCNVGNDRFVTPKHNTFAAVAGATNDYQMIGGEFDVILDMETGTVEFQAIDYKWNDRAFVVGSVLDQNGEEHRWKNDEMCPLLHQGDGVYEGDVTFFMDPNHANEGEFLTFTIFGVRATTGLYEFNYSATRSSWTEGRYGSQQNAILLEEGVEQTGLIRGSDRQWWMVWDNENTYVKYHITFDMNAFSVTIAKSEETDEDGIEKVNGNGNGNNFIYNLNGQRVSKAQKGIFIVDSKKMFVK